MSEQIESALHCGGMAPSFENEVEYYRRRVAELEQRLRKLEAAAELALTHVLELEDAWQRGAIKECDGKGGERSNRNIEVRNALQSAKGAA